MARKIKIDRVTELTVHLDGRCWPRRIGDSVALAAIESRLTYGEETEADRLFAAAVLRAYSAATRSPKVAALVGRALSAANAGRTEVYDEEV